MASLPMPPIAMPTFARASAGASLTPSPIIATGPYLVSSSPIRAPCLRQQLAVTLVHARAARDRVHRLRAVAREHREVLDAERAQRLHGLGRVRAHRRPRRRSAPTCRPSARSSRSSRPENARAYGRSSRHRDPDEANRSAVPTSMVRRRRASRRGPCRSDCAARRSARTTPRRLGRAHDACASGCGERFSAQAASASTCSSVAPFSAITSVTSKRPCVSVPVGSNAIAFTRPSASMKQPP